MEYHKNDCTEYIDGPRKNLSFEIDSTYTLVDFGFNIADTTDLAINRSDIKAIDKSMKINQLKIEFEKQNNYLILV